MAYIGREPQIGNFQICDDITVVNGQAAYTMQVGGANVIPETSNHCLVSLNGVLQKSGGTSPSFTVSGSTITFASNLATGDVINFIHILGSVLDLGTPSDGTVTNAKLAQDIISGETALTSEPASTDEFLVSDAGTLKRIDYSLISNRPAFNVYGGAASVSNNTYTKLAVSTERFDIGSCFDLGSNDRFTPDVSGKYLLYLKAEIQSGNDTDYFVGNIYKNGSSGQAGAMVQRDYNIMTFMQLAEANGSGDYFEAYAKQQSGGSVNIVLLEFSGFKLIGV